MKSKIKDQHIFAKDLMRLSMENEFDTDKNMNEGDGELDSYKFDHKEHLILLNWMVIDLEVIEDKINRNLILVDSQYD